MRECDSQGWDLRTTVASILLSWITLSEGSQIICYGDTQGGLWRGPCDKEPRPPASYQQQLARHTSRLSASLSQIFQQLWLWLTP